VPNIRPCLVAFTDSQGITHGVQVCGESLYEAAVLALAEFRRCGFTNAVFGPATRLRVSVEAPATTHEVSVAKIHAWLLRCNATGAVDVYGLVHAMAAECHPTLTRSAIKDAVMYSKTMRRMRDQTIADWLNVTRAEAELLEGLPPANSYRIAEDATVKPMPRQLQRQTVADRRAIIQTIITETGHVPDVRTMSRLIIDRGFRGNHQTVFTDYKALSIEWERTRKARAGRSQGPEPPTLYCLQESVNKDRD